MKPILIRTVVLLSSLSSFGLISVVASAADGDLTSVHNYHEAATKAGISDEDFEAQIQKSAMEEKPVKRTDVSRIHFEFRNGNAYDQSYRIQKYSKSAYHLKSNTVRGISWYNAEAWGQSYKAGRTGNVSVSARDKNEHNIYKIHANTRYKLTNYLVERYGTGNNTYIMAWKNATGHAWGYWDPDVAP